MANVIMLPKLHILAPKLNGCEVELIEERGPNNRYRITKHTRDALTYVGIGLVRDEIWLNPLDVVSLEQYMHVSQKLTKRDELEKELTLYRTRPKDA